MHRSSHVSLLTPCPEGSPNDSGFGDVHAVAVPTNRPAPILSAAIGLAGDLGCPVLILCSGESRARAAGALLGATTGAAVTVSSAPRHPLLGMPTQRPRALLSQPYIDTGTKRNVALLVGRMLGWRNVLFLDDDISGLDAAQVRQTVATVSPEEMPVVAWRYRDFPDNSVACHARRSCGLAQEVFVGAGALLVDLARPLPYFPSIYNEDWLFWHDVAARRELGLAGEAKQVPYDPFLDPQRARREEFGDVLAEGLYELIHERRSVLVGCLPGYWHGVLAERRAMLASLDAELWRQRQRGTHTHDGHLITRVLRSVAACRQALASVTARDLAEFTSTWRFDLYCWNARLHRLPRFDQLTEALTWLGITDVYPSGSI